MEITVPLFNSKAPSKNSTPQTVQTNTGTFLSEVRWNPIRPRVLVVACSDGRLQRNLDDFLNHRLGITDYDRVYIAGGPGALSSSGYDFLRGDQFRRDTAFLLEAHGVEEAILIFHGAAADGDAHDGPAECVCADYRRKFPNLSPAQINAQQAADFIDLKRRLFDQHPKVRVHAYRAEVLHDTRVRFVALSDSGETTGASASTPASKAE